MGNRKVYHVTKNSGDGWDVKKEGGERASGHFDTKADLPQIDRLLDLGHSSQVAQIEQAAAAMGKHLVMSIE
jgi:hypothetical protein